MSLRVSYPASLQPWATLLETQIRSHMTRGESESIKDELQQRLVLVPVAFLDCWQKGEGEGKDRDATATECMLLAHFIGADLVQLETEQWVHGKR